MSIYDDIRRLMADAEAAHKRVDQEFEVKLQNLLQGNGAASPAPRPVGVPAGDVETVGYVRVVSPPEAQRKQRARSGGVRDAVRAILGDGQAHKLADMMHATGMARGSIFNALARMVERDEVESLGDGVYRMRTREGAAAQTQFS